jgi:hypothetical protein
VQTKRRTDQKAESGKDTDGGHVSMDARFAIEAAPQSVRDLQASR